MDNKPKHPEMPDPETLASTIIEIPINPSGHRQELDRNFNLLSICSLAITTGNTWIALGGSVAVAIYDGGPPGVLYEFIAVSIFYWLVAASIAELASAMPSSGGVYHCQRHRWAIRKGVWVVCWLLELPCLDLWTSCYGADCGCADCEHVCGISSGVCNAEVACFCCLYHFCLALLLSCAFC